MAETSCRLNRNRREDGGGLCGFCDTARDEGLEAVLRVIAKTRLGIDTRLQRNSAAVENLVQVAGAGWRV